MASDKQQFHKASLRYHELIDHERYSAVDEPGSTWAILVPFTEITYHHNDLVRNPADSFENFKKEGELLAEQVAQVGYVADMRLRATVEDFEDVLTCRAVSRITFCGMGNFSAIQVAPPKDKQLRYLPSRRDDGWLRWIDLAYFADHLKRGTITQRVCGNFNSVVNVPLGWGVVDDHRKIIAAPGKSIYPVGLEHKDNKKLVPITTERYLGYEAIVSMFPRSQTRQRHGIFLDRLPDSVYFSMTTTKKIVKSIIRNVSK